MRLPDPPRRQMREPLLPMINVVFLLLVFFLIAARLAPPEPFPVALPEVVAQGAAPGAGAAVPVLYLSAEGLAGFGDLTGEAALRALAAACDRCGGPDAPRLILRADAGAEIAVLAALLPRLSGFAGVDLVTVAAR